MNYRYPTIASLLLSPLFAIPAARCQNASPPSSGQPVAIQAAVTPTEFRITGTLVNSVTGEPLAHYRVMAAMIPAAGVRHRGLQGALSAFTDSVQSDSTGRFALLVSSAGAWRLTASGRGFRSQNYEEHDGFSSSVVLTSSAPSVDLAFKLAPDAEIEGMVLDEAGEPIRNATVALLESRLASPDLLQRPSQNRGTTLTDDRGHYDFADLAPGDYLISLHARPWYATPGLMTGGASYSTPNPLDVVYPAMWYPDVTDFSAATPLSLQAGDRREADFHPIPQNSFHLRIAAPSRANLVQNEAHNPNIIELALSPNITELSPDGTEPHVQGQVQRDAQGNLDISGLAPGSYEVQTAGSPKDAGSPYLVDLNASSPRAIDLNSAPLLSSVTIALDAGGDLTGLQINLIDMTSGRSTAAQVSASNSGSAPRSQDGRAIGDGSATDGVGGVAAQERSVQLQPGSYEVVLSGTGDRYLSGITASDAEAIGRVVRLHAGSARLVLHMASGRASLSGIAKLHEQPVMAATVLLVPATLGDPKGVATIQRDQTNTDGSFSLDAVLPGAYILVAIDHGWTVNWRDLTTLRRYLTGGIAVDIAPGASLRRDVEAQNP